MKNFLIMICFLVFILPRARSQDADLKPTKEGGGSFTYGVKGGLVSSVFAQNSQKMENTESRTAFSLGLYGNYQINDKFGISLEALYVQEGTMHLDPNYIYYSNGMASDGYNYITGDNAQSNLVIRRVNSNIILHNFEFPLLVNYSLPKMGGIQPKAFIGGSFDFIYRAYAHNLLSYISKYNNPEDAYVLSKRTKDNVTSSFEYYNISGVFGIGADFGKFNMDVRYKMGFRPINNLATYNLQNGYRADFTSNVLMISIGVNLNDLF